MNDQPMWQRPIAEGCFMVGRRNPESLLQCNTYLRSFAGSGAASAHWCVDPGSQVDYPEVKQHLLDHIGELAALRMFSINHQDPDVVGNLIFLTQENPRLTGLTTEDTWRLVRHLNVRPKHLFLTNKADQNLVKLPGGQRLQFVATPFCHFRGAMAIYDPESRVLFSGDLFGGLNAQGRMQLYGEEADWPGIAQFHQIYMPCTSALDYAIRQIRALKPAVRTIAPQHGFVLSGEFMATVMDRLQTLPVGMDLLPTELDERYLEGYREVLGDVVQTAAQYLGRDEVAARLKKLASDHELHQYIHVTGTDVELKRHGIRALPLVVDELGSQGFDSFRALLKSKVMQGCGERGIPVPPMGFGMEGAAGEAFVIY